MPQVDFYTIKESTLQGRLNFACRLTEKAFTTGMKVYLHTDNANTAEELDNLLWSFKPESFIPHAIQGVLSTEEENELPVLIGYGSNQSHPDELLINLAETIPSSHQSFTRIAEIIINDDEAKELSRQHWREYKTAGHDLNHHQL